MSHQFTSPRLGQSQRQLASPLLDSKVGLAGCNSRPGRPQRLHICAAIKKDTAKHVVCSKTLVGKPDQVKRLQRKCQDILDFSLGRAANKQNGILEFTCSQDSYATNVFHFWERYDGNTSMGRHNTTPEFMKFMEGVQNLIQEPIGLALYVSKGGQLSHACVQGGPKGEGGLDDATGASKAAGGGASMKQTSQTVNLGDVKRGDEGDSWGMGFKFPWQKEKK